MALPSWRRRELEARQAEDETRTAAQMAHVFGLASDDDQVPYEHNFGGPHQHRCPLCHQTWTHAVDVCRTPQWFVECGGCR